MAEETINEFIGRREKGLEKLKIEQAMMEAKGQQSYEKGMRRLMSSPQKKNKAIKIKKAGNQEKAFRKLGKFQKKRLEAIVGKPITSAQRQKEFKTYRLNNLQRTRINIENANQLKAMRLNNLGMARRRPFEPRGWGR